LSAPLAAPDITASGLILSSSISFRNKGKLVKYKPEYEECKAIAKEKNISNYSEDYYDDDEDYFYDDYESFEVYSDYSEVTLFNKYLNEPVKEKIKKKDVK
jgi:hypothetical protein